jgi:hypothetical protein
VGTTGFEPVTLQRFSIDFRFTIYFLIFSQQYINPAELIKVKIIQKNIPSPVPEKTVKGSGNSEKASRHPEKKFTTNFTRRLTPLKRNIGTRGTIATPDRNLFIV